MTSIVELPLENPRKCLATIHQLKASGQKFAAVMRSTPMRLRLVIGADESELFASGDRIIGATPVSAVIQWLCTKIKHGYPCDTPVPT